jgi:alpha-tubulin suppressor-like RCC1 family protein
VIRATNEVWCWGENDKLQLGDGPERMPEATDRAPRFMPVRVIGL